MEASGFCITKGGATGGMMPFAKKEISGPLCVPLFR
jgi:hypothetical protein